MEFLIRAELSFPEGFPAEEKLRLLEAETAFSTRLRETGVLKRIWRVPGRWAMMALYEAADATELHRILIDLPLWEWLTINVEPLAQHPLEGGPTHNLE